MVLVERFYSRSLSSLMRLGCYRVTYGAVASRDLGMVRKNTDRVDHGECE